MKDEKRRLEREAGLIELDVERTYEPAADTKARVERALSILLVDEDQGEGEAA